MIDIIKVLIFATALLAIFLGAKAVLDLMTPALFVAMCRGVAVVIGILAAITLILLWKDKL